MTTRVAINGLGRIGRSLLKLVMEEPSLVLVAVNDRVDVQNLAYLLRFDTVYGRYKVDPHGMNAHEGLTFQILKGQRRVVWPEKWAETKPELPMPEWSKR